MGSHGKEMTEEKESGPEDAMTFATETGFATVSSSLLALPGPAAQIPVQRALSPNGCSLPAPPIRRLTRRWRCER